MSQPVVSELVAPDMDAADDAVTDSDVNQSQPVVSSSVNTEKWEKYKYKINKTRREKYKTNLTSDHLTSQVVTNNDLKLDIGMSQPVISSSVNTEKWEKYKYKINKTRREKYKTNLTSDHLRSEVVTNNDLKLDIGMSQPVVSKLVAPDMDADDDAVTYYMLFSHSLL